MSVLGVHGISKIAYFRRAGEDPAAAADAMGVDWTAWIDRGVAKYTPTRQPPGAVSIGYYADCLAGDVAMGPEDPEHLGSLGQELFVTWVEEISRERFGAEQFSQNAAHKWAVGKPAAFVVNHYGEQLCGILSRLSGDLASYFGPDHGERREMHGGGSPRRSAATGRGRCWRTPWAAWWCTRRSARTRIWGRGSSCW